MAHELFGTRFIERNNGKPAWHGIGEVYDANLRLRAADALVRAGGNYTVRTAPLLVEMDGKPLYTGQHMIVRDEHTFQGKTDPAAIIGGPVSHTYHVIQNTDIAAALDLLSEEWPVETVGVLQDGAKMFMVFDGGEFDIKGDPNHMYFTATDSKNGKEAFQILCTPVRVVCNNTLIMGKAAATFKASIAHTPDAYRDLKFWQAMIPQMQKNAMATREALDLLASKSASKDATALVFERAFPAPKVTPKMSVSGMVDLTLDKEYADQIAEDVASHDYFKGRTEGIRAAAWERLDVFNQENPATAGTLYAVAQAANEVSMWRKGKSDSDEHNAGIDESSVFGNRAKESARAFVAATNIAQFGLAKAKAMSN